MYTNKVHIIAHSMGGLDARHLISRLGYSDRVASLSTISTPHHGTRIADELLAMTKPGQDDALNTLATILGKKYTSEDLAENPDLQAAFRDLSERHAPEFNAETPDKAPPVFYQSWAGISHAFGAPNPTGRDQEDCALSLISSTKVTLRLDF
jgi:triacylglycerol lipase